MKRTSSKLVVALAAMATFCGVETSRGAILYLDSSSISAEAAYNGVAGGNGLLGYGDDYNTGTTNTVLTGLTFYGGFQTSDTSDMLDINFYNSNEVFVTSLAVSNAEVQGNSALHTLAASDFGSGISIPGSGYIIFAPYNVTDTTPQFALGYGTTAPVDGTSLTTNAKTDDNGDFTIGNNVVGFGAVPYARLELDGTGTAVPEPASIGLLASSGLLLLRRRRVG